MDIWKGLPGRGDVDNKDRMVASACWSRWVIYEEAGVARTQYTLNEVLGIGSGQNTENGFINRIMPLVLLSVRWKAFRVKKKVIGFDLCFNSITNMREKRAEMRPVRLLVSSGLDMK